MGIQRTEKRPPHKGVTMREDVYQRLQDYRRNRPLAPPIVGIVTVAVEEWLDKQESKTK